MRKPLIIAILSVFVLTSVIWAFSYFIQPRLDQGFSNFLYLFFVAMLSAIAVLSGFFDIFKNIPRAKSFQKVDLDLDKEQGSRVRRNMLQQVRNIWIEGMLKKSLFNEVLIELNIETQPDAVEHPWDMILNVAGTKPTLISPNEKIIDIYDQAGGNLLIMRQPGSGKTTMLLELAQSAIARAEKDYSQPIPVVLNLFSWTPSQSIGEWIIEELKDKYFIPEKIANYWLSKNELMLLLDGLDEVRTEYRPECILALNSFLTEFVIPIVVCSRVAEYEEVALQLKLQSAILIKPLNQEQIMTYLRTAGKEIATGFQLVLSDAELKELLQTPLMLNIMVLAFSNVSLEKLREISDPADNRKYLFDAYVDRMFKKRRADQRYSPTDIVKWLSWLAQRMIEHSQSIFYIDNIGVDWLLFPTQILHYRLLNGLFLWLLFGLLFIISGGLWAGLFMGLIIAFIIWLGVNFYDNNFHNVGSYNWSWSKVKNQLIGGSLFGTVIGLLHGTVYGGSYALIYGAFYGLLLTFIVGMMQIRVRDTESQFSPGRGIKDWFKATLLGGLLYSTIGVLLFGLHTGIVFGILIGLLFFGGSALLLFTSLYLLLYRAGYIPWNYIHFLNFATNHIFLRRVGGGYVFIHRALMEYFAALKSCDHESKRIAGEFSLT